MEEALNTENTLAGFLTFLYEGLPGYVYMAYANPADKSEWHQKFYDLKEQDALGRLERDIRDGTNQWDVYLAPATFKRPHLAEKEDVLATNVLWTEFDGNAPSEWDEGSKPSLIVQSSDAANQHVYWRLENALTDIQKLEDTNRNIAYALSADQSAWDPNQVLRPPETKNHKPERKGARVAILHQSNVAYDVEAFNSLPHAPEKIETSGWEIASLPNSQDVLLTYAFGPDLVRLLDPTRKPKDRSKALMNLAYGCCEMGMSDVEVFTMLRVADDMWGKFKDRKDRNQRLADIIVRARHKHPEVIPEESDDYNVMAFGWESFLATDIELEWIIEGMLMDLGSMVFVGPSGVGKTQFSLQGCVHVALGKDWLHYKIEKPKKILCLSLEMGHGELKIFLEAMSKALTPSELALLETNFIVVPWGEPWALNKPEGQQLLNNLIEEFEPEGLFIDSIGSAISGNISDDTNVQPYTEYIDKIRKRYSLFTWAIHHLRKKGQGEHGYSQDDVYGNQYLFNRASVSYLLTKSKNASLRVRNLKMRLADGEADYFVNRDTATLTFSAAPITVPNKFEDLKFKAPPNPTTSPGGIEL